MTNEQLTLMCIHEAVEGGPDYFAEVNTQLNVLVGLCPDKTKRLKLAERIAELLIDIARANPFLETLTDRDEALKDFTEGNVESSDLVAALVAEVQRDGGARHSTPAIIVDSIRNTPKGGH